MLKIDITQLNDTIAKYNDAIDDFRDTMNSLESTINDLKTTDWKSGASSAYFAMYTNSWKANMQRHLDIITHLRDCLIKAREEYTDIYYKVHEIGTCL